MFKLLVLCAFLAAVTASPGLLANAYSSNFKAPAAATAILPGQPNYFYSSPSFAPYSPLASPLAPYYSSPVYSTASHFIKKRSAPLLLPSTYITPSYSSYAAAPLVTSAYAAGTPIVHTPLISSAPITYGAHFIKKRSAPLALAPYAAPASYSHQSRFDFQASSPALTTTYSYGTPFTYSSPIAYQRFY